MCAPGLPPDYVVDKAATGTLAFSQRCYKCLLSPNLGQIMSFAFVRLTGTIQFLHWDAVKSVCFAEIHTSVPLKEKAPIFDAKMLQMFALS